MSSENVYHMKVDLNVLRHLGLTLYSNVAAVVSEVVANAWDADATVVSIDVDASTGVIKIQDDGCGMSVSDANDRYLKVGYSKRVVEGAKSKGGRSVMGRKGIGKLSLFSIASNVKIESSDGTTLHGFEMSVTEIETAIKANSEYCPRPIQRDLVSSISRGTRITLTSLRKRATAQTIAALRKRIARRFSVFSDSFQVHVNTVPISSSDREDLSKVQLLWMFGAESSIPKNVRTRVDRSEALDSTIDIDNRAYPVTGWIGSAALPRDLESADCGNINSIIVMSRGRLIQENILDRVNIGGLFTKYLTGQIEADFLDLDDLEDIATSDRQRVIEDDPRYVALLGFMRQTLNKIEARWAEWRAEIGTEKATEQYPKISEWIEGLPASTRGSAKKVIGAIQSLPLDDESQRTGLLRHGLIAFERLRLSESTEKLAAHLEVRAEDLLPLLGDQDQLEAALYLDIIRSRLQVIRSFEGLVDANEKEKVLQKFLFEHLWLIDPSWARAIGSERMEQNVQREFASITAKLSPEECKGRIDIRYRTMAGKHVIIELKRYSAKPSVWTLGEQGEKYVSATKKVLRAAGKEHEPVEIVFVLGDRPAGVAGRDLVRTLDPIAGRVVTYEELIQSAIAGYKEYLARRRKIDAIEALLRPS